MSNKSPTDAAKRCEEWILLFSWERFRNNRNEVFDALPDVSDIDIETLTSLLRAFFTKHNVPLMPIDEANGSKGHAVYNNRFYDEQRDGSRRSADEIVPYLMELVKPRRVVDVGCGVGTWLATFVGKGVEHVLGIEGSWVKGQNVLIPEHQFSYMDLRYPLEIDERFDLAVSVEVAEHLPMSSAESFISSLCRLAPIVCFSGAIPLQGGTCHINEQWPKYWIEQFARHDYQCLDCLRGRLWENDRIGPYYAQNMFLFCSQEAIESNDRLQKLYERQAEGGCKNIQTYVHPKVYLSSILNGLFAGVSLGGIEQ